MAVRLSLLGASQRATCSLLKSTVICFLNLKCALEMSRCAVTVPSAQGRVCVAVGQMGSANWQVAGLGRFARAVVVGTLLFLWPSCPQHDTGFTPAPQPCPVSLH